MDTTQQMPQSIALPSRYFWRRLAAFAVDIVIFQGAILIAVHYISTAFPAGYHFPGWAPMECTDGVPDQLAKRIDAGWPLKANEFRTNKICEVRQFGFGKQRYLQITVLIEPWDYVTPAQELTVPLDADDNPVIKIIPAYPGLISGTANTMLIVLAFASFFREWPPHIRKGGFLPESPIRRWRKSRLRHRVLNGKSSNSARVCFLAPGFSQSRCFRSTRGRISTHCLPGSAKDLYLRTMGRTGSTSSGQ
ncbi:hypothetical protein [Rhizobium leguminosarum]